MNGHVEGRPKRSFFKDNETFISRREYEQRHVDQFISRIEYEQRHTDLMVRITKLEGLLAAETESRSGLNDNMDERAISQSVALDKATSVLNERLESMN